MSSQHGSYTLGYTHPTMAKNNEPQAGNGKQISQISPQFRLGSAIRPHEVGIASNRESAGRGEYVPGPCTHRPSHHESPLQQKSVFQPAREEAAKVVVGDWGEVVTR